MLRKIGIALSIYSLWFNCAAVEVCSRTATINSQEVLVDLNSGQKGEGLRFYLEKDQNALSYLNLYQEENSIRWPYVALGSISLASILAVSLEDFDTDEQNIILGVGLFSLILNFSLSRFMMRQNEKNLIRSIEEYNQRNLPKIHFKSNANVGRVHSLGITGQWEF